MPGSRDHTSRRLRLCAAAALTALLAGCSADPAPSGGPAATANGDDMTTAAESLQRDYEKVVRDVVPSVVQITTKSSLGSGVVYDSRGDIVTNAHVVGGSKRFQVTLATSRVPLTAVLVGSYQPEDLAVVRLLDPPKDLRPATFGDSATVRVGQIALAMGNPLGLSSSVTDGIVSAVGRTVSEGGEDDGTQGATIMNLVQTSAAINPGNSGGALVDLSGKVVGIPTLAATDPGLRSSAPGIGFAIPVSTVTRIARQLVRYGRVNSGRAALGLSVRTVLGANYQPVGAVVVTVTPGAAGARAGLRPGDVVTSFGGTRVSSVESLISALAEHRPGARVTVGYDRAGVRHTVVVTLGDL